MRRAIQKHNRSGIEGRYWVLALALLLAATLIGCRGLQVASDSGPENGVAPTQSPVKHLVVVIMQNHSFDNLFGKFPGAAGPQPGDPGFQQSAGNGSTVSPFLLSDASVPDLPHDRSDYLKSWNNGQMNGFAANNGTVSMGYFDDSFSGVATLWGWAKKFALADHYFSSVMSNAPSNPLYLISANDGGMPFSFQPSFGPCQSPDPASKPLDWQNVGDQMSANNISWGWFQENFGQCGNDFVPQEDPFQYFTTTHSSPNLQDMSQFFNDLAANNLPSVSFVQPAPSHAMHPGAGSVNTGLNWLDGFLKQIQNSGSWSSTAVVVIFDEGGGWYDHVPPPQIDSQGLGMRVPLLVISPSAKTGFISHTQMDHVSILSFIQWNWSLPPLNDRNSQSGDLREMFQF